MAVALHIIRHNERRAMRRERVFRDRTNIMDSLNDIELISRYRLDRRSIFDLVDVLAPHLERPTLRNFAIPPLHQVLTTLRYYAKGGFLSEIGDIHGISRSSVSRIISSVTTSLVSSLLYKIKFPLDQPSLREIKQDFHNMYGMPNVVGAVDGTLIPIIRPSEDEQIFVCRKNYHSLNVQAICDAKMK
ncbi:HARBI1 [Mytilus edulis]|uniref:HARBI1 n=1 Tax=Mytilus edulis TaxID=6550 RepID=A0A8S3SJF9_MYTED|nr:HARBI1 [Mytilus edulis]